MVVKSLVRKGDYRDSVVLMRISKQLEAFEGVKKGTAMMATDNNKDLMKEAGLLTDDINYAGPNDLAIAVEAANENVASGAIEGAKKALSEVAPVESGETFYNTLKAATDSVPDSNLVLISTPGQFAAREAMKALRAGKHVMMFSSDVPLDDEVRLKQFASERGLLVMGPDCGTAIIGGVGLGFSNIVRNGPVGVVGAAGTGIQEVTSILDEVGITNAVGTGGHDLADVVGGITMLAGLRALEADDKTKVITVISKPPSPKVAEKILNVLKTFKKPVVVDFIGGDHRVVEEAGLIHAETLEDAAQKAIAALRGQTLKETMFSQPERKIRETVEKEIKQMKPVQKYIRGLFSGGTLCSESQLILKNLIGDVYSNVPLKKELKLSDIHKSQLNTCVDMGTEDFVRGVPHPMIDFRFRRERILREAKSPETAVILLDVVLGIGANIDPAGELVGAIKEANEIARKEGRYVSFVASVCGTVSDPQGLETQRRKLIDAGVVVMPSNAQAARMAAMIASRGDVWGKL